LQWENHVNWFAKKINDSDVTMYIACQNGQPVGVVRYESNCKDMQISVMLNPDFIGQGLGAQVIALGTRKFIEEHDFKQSILAEVKCNNVASQKAFQKAGFVENYLTYVFHDTSI
jgi:RimJ/RimL family protein N-acetyltransferase